MGSIMKTAERDEVILEYLFKCINENGYSPSVRDIQLSLGIKSTSTVHDSLSRLEKQGRIHRERGKSRALTVDALNVLEGKNGGKRKRLPIVGRVTAGMPILAEENTEGYIDFEIPEKGSKHGTYFALKVKGESMINAGILDGDIIIVRKTDYAENGKIVVAGIGDEATVKRFYREKGRYRLQPENSEMQPIIADDVYIVGEVVASIRYYK